MGAPQFPPQGSRASMSPMMRSGTPTQTRVSPFSGGAGPQQTSPGSAAGGAGGGGQHQWTTQRANQVMMNGGSVSQVREQ